MQAWKRALDAVASASLDALLDDFAGSDPGLTAIVERSKVLTRLNAISATHSLPHDAFVPSKYP